MVFTLSLLSVNADLVILDEPTAGVDPEFRYHIWKSLEGAAAEGVAVLVHRITSMRSLLTAMTFTC